FTGSGTAASVRTRPRMARGIMRLVSRMSSMKGMKGIKGTRGTKGSNGTSAEPEGVGGWLLILCRLLIVYQPVTTALSADSALRSLSMRGPGLVVAILVRLAVTGFTVAAGMALTNRAPGAVKLAAAALVTSAACDVFIYTTPYYPNNRPPGDTPLYVAASLLY